uniref:Uncharacterized protein n=1 Tax=Rhizophora mucronata TaxID=61149 RepID=A0A2P2PMF8_RHIMU
MNYNDFHVYNGSKASQTQHRYYNE